MKKLLIVNEVCGHTSTGKICGEIAEKYEKEGWKVKIAYGRDDYVPERFSKFGVRITKDCDVKRAALEARLFDNVGFSNIKNTKKFLIWAQEFDPDMIWLHNLHGYYLNVKMLFNWIKNRRNICVKWTLHDCWPFTGHCTYFSYIRCEKWKVHCNKCPQKYSYPKSILFDKSALNFDKKREVFTGVKNLTIITPSNWLANLVNKSFLKDYPIVVEPNTIDKTIFKPTQSDFRIIHNFENKIIVLGVANMWNERKGLNDFIALSKKFNDNYQIVLIGLNDKQIKSLPTNIFGLKKTNSPDELAAIYTAADVLVITSREETFGMTQIEAAGCGTPSIVYKDTACEEIAHIYGNIVVSQNIDELYRAVITFGGK